MGEAGGCDVERQTTALTLNVPFFRALWASCVHADAQRALLQGTLNMLHHSITSGADIGRYRGRRYWPISAPILADIGRYIGPTYMADISKISPDISACFFLRAVIDISDILLPGCLFIGLIYLIRPISDA